MKNNIVPPIQSGQIKYLNNIRIIALFLVLFAHLVTVPSVTPTMQEYFSNGFILPVLPSAIKYIGFDLFLQRFLHTACGPIGVVLFILLSGYLATISRHKYTNQEFITKRIIRLWPGLFLSLTFVTLLVMFVGGVKISGWQYFFNIFLLQPIVGYPPITGVVWVLIIEMLYYLIMTFVKKINIRSISIINLFVMFLLFFEITSGNTSLQLLNSYARFIPLMLFGSAIQIYGLKNIRTILLGLWSYAIIVASQKLIFTNFYFYTSSFTYTIPLLIWVCSYYGTKYIKTPKLLRFGFLDKLKSVIINTSYIVYLIHVTLGIYCLYYLRNILPTGLNIITSVFLVFVISYIIHRFMEKPISNYLTKKFIKKS